MNTSKHILMSGGTGLIGREIRRQATAAGHRLTILTRRAPDAGSDQVRYANLHARPDELAKLAGETDWIINLAGASVANRWTPAMKKEIMDSRIQTTDTLVRAVNQSQSKPECFFSASAVGIYGYDETRLFTESSATGQGFLAEVCKRWEAAVEPLDGAVRSVIGRIGVVMDSSEGALSKLALPYRFFVGGPIGPGTQWLSWIHRSDVAAMILWSLSNEHISGALNIVGPTPVQMRTLCKEIGAVLSRPSLFTVPAAVLHLILGEGAEVATKGTRVSAQRAIDAGYSYKFETLRRCLDDLLV